MLLEESPVGESQSNGTVERAVQDVQGMTRVIKEGLEEKLGERITTEHNLVPWLVKHAAQLVTRYRIREDGKTAHEKIRGKKFRRETAEFGECVWYLKPGTKGKEKWVSRWGDGVWLGIRDESGETIIGTKQGTIKVATFRRKGDPAERWNKEEIMGIVGVPWEPVPGSGRVELKSRVVFPEERKKPESPTEGEEKEKKERREYITMADLKKYGFTMKGCEGCKAAMTALHVKKPGVKVKFTAKEHSQECRNRIEEALAIQEPDRWQKALE